jgi:hypothetical protein
MTRLYQPPQPIEATSDDEGEPLSFEWRGRAHPVLQASSRWRIHLEWWRREIWREYFQVETGGHLTGIIYRDLLTDRWYLERIFD